MIKAETYPRLTPGRMIKLWFGILKQSSPNLTKKYIFYLDLSSSQKLEIEKLIVKIMGVAYMPEDITGIHTE